MHMVGQDNFENASLKVLEGELETFPLRDRAEIALALMFHYRDKRDDDKVLKFGRRSMELFAGCDTDDEASCCVRHPMIAGIALPDLVHADVADYWLKRWGLLPAA